MDAKTLAFLHNNKDHRLKMICLGNTCIDDRHIKILNGDHKFKLKSKEDNKCLTHSTMWFHEWNHHFGDDYRGGDTPHWKTLIYNSDCDGASTLGLKLVNNPGEVTTDTSSGSSVSKDMSPEPRFMNRQSSSDEDTNFTL